jgi:pimeloyl-ACP methyl ester carboxylesterase
MAPVARGLADRFRVLEPFQRGSGPAPLTVARHVQDLHEMLQPHGAGARPALVGSSWGAMLALAYAAQHPDRAGPLVLVGCGTFDEAARDEFRARVRARTDASLQQRLDRLAHKVADPDERLAITANLLLPVYSHDLVTDDLECERCDARAHRETWADMERLQKAGVYPQAFSAVRSPVLMLHGTDDPHPGSMIRASLEPYLPQLEYREWEQCGHYPWLERAVQNEFFQVLRSWLARYLTEE